MSSLNNWFYSVKESLMSHEQEKNSGPCQAWKVAEPVLGHVKILKIFFFPFISI